MCNIWHIITDTHSSLIQFHHTTSLLTKKSWVSTIIFPFFDSCYTRNSREVQRFLRHNVLTKSKFLRNPSFKTSPTICDLISNRQHLKGVGCLHKILHEGHFNSNFQRLECNISHDKSWKMTNWRSWEVGLERERISYSPTLSGEFFLCECLRRLFYSKIDAPFSS